MAITLGTAGGALARDPMMWPNPQSHDSSLDLDSETPWQPPKTRAEVDRMYTNSINRPDPACANQDTDNARSRDGAHLTQGQGCD
ncbi:hypothetical protein AAE028_36115 [Sinorhizobium sp. CB9]